MVKVWLATTLAAMIGLMIGHNFLGQQALFTKLALSSGLSVETLWQVFTYPLAQRPDPQGLTSYLISAVFFWLVVSPYELQWGRRMLIQLLVAITLGAALPAVAIGLFFQGAVFGFGPHVLGVIAAYAWAIRHRGQLSFFGVLPMKAVHLIGLCVFLSLLQFLAHPDVVRFSADLGAVGLRDGMPDALESQRAHRGALVLGPPDGRADLGDAQLLGHQAAPPLRSVSIIALGATSSTAVSRSCAIS